MFAKLIATINRYLTLIGDQQIIDQRIKELYAFEKQIKTKQALLGDADAQDLQTLTHSEQIKLLKALILQKVANNESAEEAIAALTLIENKPPHAIKHDHLYSIPVLSEIADVIRCAFNLSLMGGVAIALVLLVNPNICQPTALGANNSQLCKATRAFDQFFFDYQQE